jgi:hypothetical protein
LQEVFPSKELLFCRKKFQLAACGACLPTAFISFGCPKETEPKKKHHAQQLWNFACTLPYAHQKARQNSEFTPRVDKPTALLLLKF